MNIKMIVTDLDGTLLRTDKTISDYSIETFRICREDGIKIAFATARNYRGNLMDYIELVECDAVITNNGSALYIDGKEIKHIRISQDSCRAIIDFLREINALKRIAFKHDDYYYANFDLNGILPFADVTICDAEDFPNQEYDRIIIDVGDDEKIEEMRKFLPDNLYIINHISGGVGIIQDRSIDKIYRIIDLAEKWDIKLEEIVAFGDEENDIEMLRWCGTGVAVSNAIPETTEVADYVCDSNDEDGVAHWIAKNILT